MNPPALLAIRDFSRANHMSVKMLRHYHQIGLLESVEVDRCTGSRRDQHQPDPNGADNSAD